MPEALLRDHLPRDRAAASNGDHFLTHKMKPDHVGSFAIFEMATHRITDLRVKTWKIVGFGEDRLS
jgi:hypothetical protein